MPHAEPSSTSELPVPPAPHKTPRKHVFAGLGLAVTIGIASAVIASPRSASADQISDAKAQAAAITAKIQATEAQISALTGQVQAADYQLSQLSGQIAANQAEVAKDQAQLRSQAISDYTSSGTTNQVTQMFSSSPNTSDIRSEYASIAAGNVTTTIDHLHTAQSQLQAAQSALQQQQSQATATRNNLQASENQATALASQDQATLNSVNANIQNLVAQQQAQAAAAAKAAATAAFNSRLAASQRAQTAAASAPARSSGPGAAPVSAPAGPAPPLSGGAAGAVQAAESQVGVPYVWGGDTPAGFDCSGLVMWSYAQVGIGLPRTSGAQYGATTHIPLATSNRETSCSTGRAARNTSPCTSAAGR